MVITHDWGHITLLAEYGENQIQYRHAIPIGTVVKLNHHSNYHHQSGQHIWRCTPIDAKEEDFSSSRLVGENMMRATFTPPTEEELAETYRSLGIKK